jgi:hypothetical protein
MSSAMIREEMRMPSGDAGRMAREGQLPAGIALEPIGWCSSLYAPFARRIVDGETQSSRTTTAPNGPVGSGNQPARTDVGTVGP